MDEDFISYNARKEMEAILSWYAGWKENEKQNFLKTLKTLIQPSIDDLLGVMETCKIEKYDLFFILHLRVKIKFSNWSAPNVFACQMKLVCDWFRLWDAEERNMFQFKLKNILDQRENAFLFE